jgi:hypothetical protein
VRTKVALLALVLVAVPAFGQDRPLVTENPELLSLGIVHADFGVEFYHRQLYTLSGLEGDLMRLGVTSVRVGVGEYAEFQISGVFRDFLTVANRTTPVIPPTFAGNSTSDFGDIILGTKLKLAGEGAKRPAISFKFAVQLPNATNESGLGADETEFYARTLVAKHFGKAEVIGNIGMAILGSSIIPNTQADLLTYGAAFVLPVRNKLELVGEVNGRQGPPRVGNESLSQALLGARVHAAGLRWDVAGLAGLKHFSPGSGLKIGVTYEFQAFQRKKGPKTIPQGAPKKTMPPDSR